jgi:GAF domain-containing protein
VTDPIDPTGVLGELAKLVAADREMSVILDDVVHLVRRRIDGADEVSVTLVRDEKASTVACTGSLAMDLDELQYEEGYGPCLDAGRTDEVKHIVDAATETRWPRYLPRALENGLGSSLSVPLPVENYLVGAINIYSRTPRAFDRDSVALAVALATHVTAALSVAETAQGHRDRALHLRRALESHAVIDQAKGMIMVQQKCPADVAFEMLRKLSMDQNIKLYELAAALVASGSNHPVQRSF